MDLATSEKSLKLHLGCGSITPVGWVNIDGSWNARFAKVPWMRQILQRFKIIPEKLAQISWDRNVLVRDIRRPLPFPAQSIDVIYASHLIDCLTLVETKRLLKECFRLLRSGGVLRVVVEDVRSIVQEYLDGRPSPGLSPELVKLPAIDRMMARLTCQNPDAASGNFLYELYRRMTDFQTRKWAYDAQSLMHHFQQAGFVQVSQKKSLESRIDRIEEIEKTSGICVEGVRP